ncbi:MAG: phage tail protein [Dehalococcoidia bacterium]|nr:phage tail protein [Dehalococcoidia bacterium]
MTQAVDTSREDFLVGCRFKVDVGGVITGYFTECSGLGSETEIVESKVVNDKGVEVVLKVPGRLKWGDITLKRGITSDMQIWDWRKKVEDGDVNGARRNGSIVMYDQSLRERARWNFMNGWPSKVSGPSPKADSNEIGIEELVIVHEYITRDS